MKRNSAKLYHQRCTKQETQKTNQPLVPLHRISVIFHSIFKHQQKKIFKKVVTQNNKKKLLAKNDFLITFLELNKKWHIGSRPNRNQHR